MAGTKAGKKENPKPLVEKVAQAKPVDDNVGKTSEKAPVVTETAPPPAPKVEEKPVEKKPDPPKAVENKPKEEPKPEEKKPDPVKPDPINEALKKEEKKPPPPKPVQAAKPPEPPKQKIVERHFDQNQIAALLDKREPQRQAAAGDALVPVPGLGTASGNAPKLSQSEIDALRSRLMQLWNVPAGVQNPEELRVTVVIRIGRDRKLSAPPRVLTSGTSPMFQAARDNAMRAVFMSQPFDMLRPENYDLWKEIEITFDPRYMNGG